MLARLKALRREVTVFRFLRESLGDRPEFARILEWNLEAHPYFVESEYGGPNLAEWAESQGGLCRIGLELRLQIFIQIAQAVTAAHDAGVLHKDLKPANVLVCASTEDQVRIKLVDFGSASLLEPARLKELGITNMGLTQTGDLSHPLTGTLMYMAPEVFCGQPPTAASDVYALGVMLYQFVIGDFRKPLSPGWESSVQSPLLRDDIAQSVCGDPAQRLGGPAQLVGRILSLDDRRRELQRQEEERKHKFLVEQRRAKFRARLPWVALACVVVVAVASVLIILRSRRQSPAPSPSVRSVAVLPFQEIGPDHRDDYLRFALADEIATTLSYDRGLSIRPFRIAPNSNGVNVDLLKVGQVMGVHDIVTGRLLKQGGQLQITIEAFDVHANNLLWRDTVDLPSDNLIQMHERITSDNT